MRNSPLIPYGFIYDILTGFKKNVPTSLLAQQYAQHHRSYWGKGRRLSGLMESEHEDRCRDQLVELQMAKDVIFIFWATAMDRRYFLKVNQLRGM